MVTVGLRRGINPFIFPHVWRETTYKLRPQLSCSSSQVWPARISGVIEGVFRCSGPNSKSIVTLTRPVQRKNAPLPHLHLRLFSPFLGIAATGDFHIDYCAPKKGGKNQFKEHNHQDKCSSTQCQMCKVLEESERSHQRMKHRSELLSLSQNKTATRKHFQKSDFFLKWVLDDGRSSVINTYQFSGHE